MAASSELHHGALHCVKETVSKSSWSLGKANVWSHRFFCCVFLKEDHPEVVRPGYEEGKGNFRERIESVRRFCHNVEPSTGILSQDCARQKPQGHSNA